jgi:hypothetical protein
VINSTRKRRLVVAGEVSFIEEQWMGQASWVLCSIAFRPCVRETCPDYAESSAGRNHCVVMTQSSSSISRKAREEEIARRTPNSESFRELALSGLAAAHRDG